MSSAILSSLAVAVLAASPTAGPANTSIRFKMWNASEHVIQEVYVSPAAESKWGRNRIARPVKPGEKLAFVVPGACGLYDLRFVAPDGIEYIREAVSFCDEDDVVRIGDRALRKMTTAQAEALEAAAAKGAK